MKNLPKVIAVVGTTASGKSDLAIELAQTFNGEILSVDSRQIYKDMNIGTNKEAGQTVYQEILSEQKPVGDMPISLSDVINNPYLVKDIPHYFISVVRPDQLLTAAHFQQLAFEVIEHIIQKGKVPILVGGTSLYTSATLENWEFSNVEPDYTLREQLQEMSLEQQQAMLKEIDLELFDTIDHQNPRRLVRAIEQAKQGAQARSHKGEAKYQALYLAPQIDREEVYERINHRVDRMIEQGWLEEIQMIGDTYGWDTVAMTGHGYRQLAMYLQGKVSKEEALEETKKVTRHYAKRQLTWWRKYGDVHWVASTEDANQLCKTFLAE